MNMKILSVQTTDWVRRNPGQQHHLLEMLSLRGHQIRVIDFEILWRERNEGLCSKRKVLRNIYKVHKGAKITVIRPSFMRIPLLDYISVIASQAREVNREVKEFSPDVILSYGIIAYIAGRAAKKNNIPFIYYWIDVAHLLIPFRLLHPIGLMMERRALKLARAILAINYKLQEYVIKIGAPREKTRVLTAGIDFKHFDLQVSKDRVRRQYGLSENDIVLFFMGWLYQFSGLKEVALQLAKLQNKHVKLLIVGEGDAYDELQRVRTELKMQDRLILVGRQPYSEIPAFILASDICLLPAYPNESIMQDIVPIKIYEYMAMKKAVISTRLPGVMKEFGESNGVIYVDKPEDVIPKALELLQKGNLEELGTQARNFVENYSWENIADEFERILKEAIKERKEVGCVHEQA